MSRSRYGSIRIAALSITVFGTLCLCATGCGGGSEASSGMHESAPETTTSNGKRSHFRGGEKDIEEFGSEATRSEQEAVLSAEQTYLSSIVSRDYGKACTLVSKSLEEQFSAIVTGAAGHKTCSQVLPRILAGDASHVAGLQLSGQVVKVRVQGDRGYVVFHAPGARLFVFPMVHEGGGWRVATITSSILAPSAATLGE
jgi:hypothetical protein